MERGDGVPGAVTVSVELPLGFGVADGTDDRQYVAFLAGLGLVVYRAGRLEMALRGAYCALVGSDYAAVTAGGQNASWLREQVLAVAKTHDKVSAEALAELRTLLGRCKDAADDRNRFVHALWATSEDGWSPLKSAHKDYRLVSGGPVSGDAFAALARKLDDCSFDVDRWVVSTLGPAALDHEVRLRWRDFLEQQGGALDAQ